MINISHCPVSSNAILVSNYKKQKKANKNIVEYFAPRNRVKLLVEVSRKNELKQLIFV